MTLTDGAGAARGGGREPVQGRLKAAPTSGRESVEPPQHPTGGRNGRDEKAKNRHCSTGHQGRTG
jgi:hypothetical protein